MANVAEYTIHAYYGLYPKALRIRLYVLKEGITPYIPILRMGFQPKTSYSREGSGFLGIGWIHRNMKTALGMGRNEDFLPNKKDLDTLQLVQVKTFSTFTFPELNARKGSENRQAACPKRKCPSFQPRKIYLKTNKPLKIGHPKPKFHLPTRWFSRVHPRKPTWNQKMMGFSLEPMESPLLGVHFQVPTVSFRVL